MEEPLLLGTPRKAASAVQSLDYNPVTNAVSLRRAKELQQSQSRHFWGYSGHTLVKLLTTVLCGAATGATAWGMEATIQLLLKKRNAVLQGLLDQDGLAAALAALLCWSVALLLLGGALVQFIAPGAAGAGVSLVIAFLNGCSLEGLLTARVYAVKLVGTVVSRVSGLALGPEAPLVHLGACAASLLCNLEHKLWSRKRAADGVRHGADGWQPPPEDLLFSNADHREMVSAGAAAGLAAAFGAPIGGVLFACEEAASSLWSRKTVWRCFICTAVATFTLAQLHPSSAAGILSLKAGTFPLTNTQWLLQLPFLALVSAGGGLLGVAFNLARSAAWPLRAPRARHGLRLLEVAAVGTVTVLTMMALAATAGRCLAVPEEWDPSDVVRLWCAPGQYNDLGTGYLGSGFFVVRSLLGMGSEAEPLKRHGPVYFSPPCLAVLSASYLGLMVLASNLAVPGGIFLPSILVGGSFGGLCGFGLTAALPGSWGLQPGLYALVGATAMLGGVFRSSISLVVIVVEGTRGIDFLGAVIVAVIVSNWIAHHAVRSGAYEAELETEESLFFLRPEPPFALRALTAGDVMATPVVGLSGVEPLSGVVDLLESTEHHGFPVFDSLSPRDPATGMGRLEGVVLRAQLEVLLQREAWTDEEGRYLAVPTDAAAYEQALDAQMQAAVVGRARPSAHSSSTPAKPYAPAGAHRPTSVRWAMDRSPAIGPSISAARAAPPHLNLRPFMSLAPASVRPSTPAADAHRLFLALSLRHLWVVDLRGQLLGVITRSDLDHAAGAGWWRRNKIAPTPRHEAPIRRGESWLASSLRSLAVPPRRIVSALVSRMSGSPTPSVLADSCRRVPAPLGAVDDGPLSPSSTELGGEDGLAGMN